MLEVTAAYGRTYKNQAEIKKDWAANLDFKIVGGPYINKSDAERYDEIVVVRYGKDLTKVCGV